jgi:hypothetical protein
MLMFPAVNLRGSFTPRRHPRWAWWDLGAALDDTLGQIPDERQLPPVHVDAGQNLAVRGGFNLLRFAETGLGQASVVSAQEIGATQLGKVHGSGGHAVGEAHR